VPDGRFQGKVGQAMRRARREKALEYQQQPERLAVVEVAGLVLAQQALDRGGGDRPLSSKVSPISRARTRPASRRNRPASEDENPCFGRYSTSGGKYGSSARLSTYLPTPPRSFRRRGSASPHSTSPCSSSGARTSSACAMLARSTFTSMRPASQVARSTYCAANSASSLPHSSINAAMRAVGS
jgi:hypothetical protein